MEIFQFDKSSGKTVTHFNSNFIMSKIIRAEYPVQIGCMHLEANGMIGFHQASVSQLLLVMAGEGVVCSDDRKEIPVIEGDAIYWKKGEGHQTITESGLTAIVIESEHLNPAEFMLVKKQ